MAVQLVKSQNSERKSEMKALRALMLVLALSVSAYADGNIPFGRDGDIPYGKTGDIPYLVTKQVQPTCQRR